jgi:signal transduction histidine kinase
LDAVPESQEKEDIKEELEAIEKNIIYINKIVQDLQDFARPLTILAREINLEDLCEAVLFKNSVPENVEASCEVAKDARKIFVDPDVLQRVLTNLIGNAVQALPKGGKIALKAFREGGEIVITVSDTGVGIPEDVKPRLFTQLFTTKSKGQGFGLAVVKRLIDSLGGTVSFESQVGKGTKFTMQLPNKTSNVRKDSKK